MHEKNPKKVHPGDTIRFSYGVSDSSITALVLACTSTEIQARLECGKDRGKNRKFLQVEMVGCYELFGSSLLQNLLRSAKDAVWTDGAKTKTADIPPYKPKLSLAFRVPSDEPYKRKYHVLKILGEGCEMLCKCTNALAKRTLSRSTSEA